MVDFSRSMVSAAGAWPRDAAGSRLAACGCSMAAVGFRLATLGGDLDAFGKGKGKSKGKGYWEPRPPME